jgi:hypothetical protein
LGVDSTRPEENRASRSKREAYTATGLTPETACILAHPIFRLKTPSRACAFRLVQEGMAGSVNPPPSIDSGK